MSAAPEAAVLKVAVYPYRKGLSSGNIIWADRNLGSSYNRVSKFAMRAGRFPPGHPVGGGFDSGSQYGESDGMRAFRERGYWASCFPEGDGITWQPEREQTFEQTLTDIRECFGWECEVPK